MQTKIKVFFTEILPDKMKEMKEMKEMNDAGNGSHENYGDDSDSDNYGMLTRDGGLSNVPNTHQNGVKDPTEDLYQKQDYSTEAETNVDAEVGVWELRLRCKDPVPDATARNPMVGTEVVYKHESQTLEVHSPPTIQELKNDENWLDLEDSVEKARQTHNNIMHKAQTSVRSILWNRMIIYHSALFLAVISLDTLYRWEKYSWFPVDYACMCKSDNNYCCRNRGTDETVQGGEVMQVWFFYIVLGLLSAYKNGWQQSLHKSYEAEAAQDGISDVLLYGTIADDGPRKGFHQKYIGSVLSRLVALLIAATPMLGKAMHLHQHVDCKGLHAMSAFTGNSTAINFRVLSAWPVMDQLAVGLALLGFVGVITIVLMQVPLVVNELVSCKRTVGITLKFKELNVALIGVLMFGSLAYGEWNDVLYVTVVPSVAAIGVTTLWGYIFTMDRTDHPKKKNLGYFYNIVDQFVGYRFTKEYKEILSVVAPPMVALFITMCRGMRSTTAPKCTRFVIHWGCFALSFTLCRVWLDVMHANYRYFERQTKLLDLFTKASSATSWHSFKRDFIEGTNNAAALKPIVSQLRRALRLKEHFDLLVLDNLAKWDNTRDVLAREWTSYETQIRESNLQWATFQLIIFLGLVFLRFFGNLSKTPKEDKSSMHSKAASNVVVEELFKRQYEKEQLMLLMLMSLFVVIPMLHTRNKLGKLQKEHTKLLEKIQHRTNIIKIHEILDGGGGGGEESISSNSSNSSSSGSSGSSGGNGGSGNSGNGGGNIDGTRHQSPSVGRNSAWKHALGLHVGNSWDISRDSAFERRQQLTEVSSEQVEIFLNKIQQADTKPEIFPGYPIDTILPTLGPIIATMMMTILFNYCKCFICFIYRYNPMQLF